MRKKLEIAELRCKNDTETVAKLELFEEILPHIQDWVVILIICF